MKDVGYTDEGNRLVEMSREEYTELMRLHEAVEGTGFPQFIGSRDYGFRESFDLTNTFGVIRAYYSNKFRINELQGFLESMKISLDKKES